MGVLGDMSKKLGASLSNLVRPKSIITKESSDELGDDYIGKYKVVPCFGKRNDFLKTLTTLTEISNTHRTCCKTKSDFIAGGSFEVLKGDFLPTILKGKKEKKTPTKQNLRDAAAWLSNVNAKGETMLDVLWAISYNYEAGGRAWIEEIRGEIDGLDGVERFYAVEVIDFAKVLFDGEDRDELKTVLISEDWDNENIEPRRLVIGEWVRDENGVERRIRKVDEKSLMRDVYPLPPAVGAMIDMQLENEAPNHNLDMFYDEFMPKVFMQFFTTEDLTETEKADFYNDLRKTFTRRKSNDRNPIYAQIRNGKSMETNIQVLDKGVKDGEYLKLNSSSEHQIFKAHTWHPLLAGVPMPGGFNNSELILNVYQFYKELVIKPRLKKYMDKVVNPVYIEASEWLGVFGGTYLDASVLSPTGFAGKLDVEKLIDVNEGRKEIGYPQLSEDEMKEFKPISKEKKDEKNIDPDNGSNK